MMNSSFRQVNLSGQGGFFMSAGGDEKWTEISSEKKFVKECFMITFTIRPVGKGDDAR